MRTQKLTDEERKERKRQRDREQYWRKRSQVTQVTQAETETDTNFADNESAIEEAMREQDVDDVVEYITSLIDHRLANVPTQQPQGNTHHQPMWPLLVLLHSRGSSMLPSSTLHHPSHSTQTTQKKTPSNRQRSSLRLPLIQISPSHRSSSTLESFSPS